MDGEHQPVRGLDSGRGSRRSRRIAAVTDSDVQLQIGAQRVEYGQNRQPDGEPAPW